MPIDQSDRPRRLMAATSSPAVAPERTPLPGPSMRTPIPAPMSAPCANSLARRTSATDVSDAVMLATPTSKNGHSFGVRRRPIISIRFWRETLLLDYRHGTQPALRTQPHFAGKVCDTASSMTPASNALLSSLQPSASSAMNLSFNFDFSSSVFANFEISISRL